MSYTNSLGKSKKRRAVLLILVVLLAGGALWLLVDKHHSKPTVIQLGNGKTATANPNVPGAENANHNPPGSAINNSKDEPANTPGTAPASNVQPSVPVGDFVSNHHPTLSGSPGPTEVSTCTTTPGITCQIRFSSGNTVKTLPAQRTNGSGSTSWDWTLQSLGLTQGTWNITAVAANGIKTATTNDATALVVTP